MCPVLHWLVAHSRPDELLLWAYQPVALLQVVLSTPLCSTSSFQSWDFLGLFVAWDLSCSHFSLQQQLYFWCQRGIPRNPREPNAGVCLIHRRSRIYHFGVSQSPTFFFTSVISRLSITFQLTRKRNWEHRERWLLIS